MEKQEFHRNAMQMLRLCACAVNRTVPDAADTEVQDPEALLAVCEAHSLTACTAYALESAKIRIPAFVQAKEKAVRKEILFDTERSQILARLSEEKIWHMPLKGVPLKKLYPRIGMRQMSDNDILFDPAFRSRVREIMEERGFTCMHFGTGHNDEYTKEPVFNFEMHPMLFTETNADGMFYAYFADVKTRLQQDDKQPFLFHFTPEDYYIYLLAHEYKHYRYGGTGVRSLLDIFIFMREYEQKLDWEYLGKELQTLHLTEFEAQNRSLAAHLFAQQSLTEAEQKQLDYFIFSGTYGTVNHEIENQLQRHDGTKGQYLFRRIFPTMKWIRGNAPFFYRHKWLIPAMWIIRPVRGLLHNRQKLLTEWRMLQKK